MGSKGCKCSHLNVPGTENPRYHLLLGLGKIPFSHYWPSGVIRIGLPSMKVEKMENFQNKTVLKGCKWSSLNAPGTETLCLIYFLEWMSSLLISNFLCARVCKVSRNPVPFAAPSRGIFIVSVAVSTRIRIFNSLKQILV